MYTNRIIIYCRQSGNIVRSAVGTISTVVRATCWYQYQGTGTVLLKSKVPQKLQMKYFDQLISAFNSEEST